MEESLIPLKPKFRRNSFDYVYPNQTGLQRKNRTMKKTQCKLKKKRGVLANILVHKSHGKKDDLDARCERDT